MLTGHLAIRVSALHHESFVQLSVRGRRGPSGPDWVLPYKCCAIARKRSLTQFALCATQPLVMRNHNWILRCLILQQDKFFVVVVFCPCLIDTFYFSLSFYFRLGLLQVLRVAYYQHVGANLLLAFFGSACKFFLSSA